MGMGENSGAFGSSSLAAPYVVAVELEDSLQSRNLHFHRCRKTEHGYQDVYSGRNILQTSISSIYYVTSAGNLLNVSLIQGKAICLRCVQRGYFIPQNSVQLESINKKTEVSPNVVA